MFGNTLGKSVFYFVPDLSEGIGWCYSLYNWKMGICCIVSCNVFGKSVSPSGNFTFIP